MASCQTYERNISRHDIETKFLSQDHIFPPYRISTQSQEQKNSQRKFPFKTVLFGVIKQSTQREVKKGDGNGGLCFQRSGAFFCRGKEWEETSITSCCVSVPQVDKEGDLEGLEKIGGRLVSVPQSWGNRPTDRLSCWIFLFFYGCASLFPRINDVYF